MRIDKWLWAARFFKTRSLAARACDIGRIECNGQTAKPARDVRVGDRLHVRSDAGDFHIDVLALSEIRGPAAVAQSLYFEPEESKRSRFNAAAERRDMLRLGLLSDTKPSKRDRRQLARFRGRV